MQPIDLSQRAGGRSEALGFAAPPKGEQGVMGLLSKICRSADFQGVRPCRRPCPKSHQKIINFSKPKKTSIFDENGAILDPQGHPKIRKILKSGSRDRFFTPFEKHLEI